MEVKTNLPQLAAGFYFRYISILDWFQKAVLLGIRLVWGFLFAQAGWGKWQDIGKVTSFFTDLGIPFPMLNAYVVSTTELVGGIFLLLGLFGRLTPIPLIIAMVVAYATTEQEALGALAKGDLDPFLTAAPFLFLFASLLILVFGPGCLSVDHILKKYLTAENAKGPRRA